ncbi:malto-oligosyltrehalose synthase [Microlunatus elymi]|uniref:Malto-oligosyltrehalose synthase n=1 Tax=Microlunatus elymi TaxID=2596828 RepID=A0A516PWF1_9ACTN|nr:malto-oligosyltrehalose synthase [Microlunatus elymi]QDP95507.1 malto-oligosyltrehalose synthase [Microlunatus elymi]
MTPVPSSTYRLQIRPGFTLYEAAELTDYLAELGVGAIYLSPLLTSVTGSDHGYDVTDPTRLDPQRGGEDGFAALLKAAGARDLPVVVDIVPNHLGVDVPEQNPAWWDVLLHGRQSAYASWFDIDWTADKLLIPILGDDPDELQRLQIDDGRLCYWEHRYPIAPGTGHGTAQEIHDRQHYRLVNHRRGQTELGYRRFFAVNTLAAVRMEDPAVFEATHRRVADLIRQGVAGLRVDHPDGLADPAGYLQRLRDLAPDAWIVVEKILEPGEELPDWPVAGTTGYDALTDFTGVFVDPAAEAELTAIYQQLTGDHRSVADHERAGKRLVLDDLFGSELRRIAALAPELPKTRAVIADAATRLDVYRGYLPDDVGPMITALAATAQDHPEWSDTVQRLSARIGDPDDEFAIRFCQLTGAVMAKGVEDTAFYRANRLTCLNEVGGNPGGFGVEPDAFHRAQAARLRYAPDTMTTLSTHDTKRSEDVRAAIAVLAEVPQRWRELCTALMTAAPMPEPTIGYLLWQVVATVETIGRDRLHAYAEKAMREAALGTGWLDQDADFETAVHGALDRAYDDPELAGLIAAFRTEIRPAVISNLLGQKLLQLLAPGVPDVYQGTEFVDDSLVDPDNRRPVDFTRRRQWLAALNELTRTEPPGADDPDEVKLWVTSRALRARRDFPPTSYRPLPADGVAAAHLLGFDVGGLIGFATRLPYGLAQRGGWGDTSIDLPNEAWTDRLTGATHTGRIAVERLLDRYPVALLVRSATEPSEPGD